MSTVATVDRGTDFADASLAARQKYAAALAEAGDLIPRSLRGPDGKPSPGKILLVAETGKMLGIHPIAAINGVNVIDGKPTISPGLMSGVVRSAGHKLRVTTSGSVREGNFEATATLIRSDDQDAPFVATWNLERATRAGLANKSNWRNYFEAMCKARAISEVCREGAEDVLMGAHYTPEEMGAEVDEEGVAIGDQQPAPAAPAAVQPDRDWKAEIAAVDSAEALTVLANETQQLGVWGVMIDGPDDVQVSVKDALFARRAELVPPTIVDVPEGKAKPRQWVREARALKTSEGVRALWREAQAAGADASVLDELSQIEASLPAPKVAADPEHAEGWAPVEPVEPGDFVEVEPGVYAEQGTPVVLAGDEDD